MQLDCYRYKCCECGQDFSSGFGTTGVTNDYDDGGDNQYCKRNGLDEDGHLARMRYLRRCVPTCPRGANHFGRTRDEMDADSLLVSRPTRMDQEIMVSSSLAAPSYRLDSRFADIPADGYTGGNGCELSSSPGRDNFSQTGGTFGGPGGGDYVFESGDKSPGASTWRKPSNDRGMSFVGHQSRCPCSGLEEDGSDSGLCGEDLESLDYCPDFEETNLYVGEDCYVGQAEEQLNYPLVERGTNTELDKNLKSGNKCLSVLKKIFGKSNKNKRINHHH